MILLLTIGVAWLLLLVDHILYIWILREILSTKFSSTLDTQSRGRFKLCSTYMFMICGLFIICCIIMFIMPGLFIICCTAGLFIIC